MKKPYISIACDECGQVFIGRSPAAFCPACKRLRALAGMKRGRIRRVTNDPDYYKRQNPQKLAWERARVAALPLPRCKVCGIELARMRGRSPKTAICAEDKTLNRRFRQTLYYNVNISPMKVGAPHPCRYGCGRTLPRAKGRRPETAACQMCRNEIRRRRRSAQRAA